MPVHKGFNCSIYAPDSSGGFSTQATGEACSLVSEATYQVTDSDKRLIDWNEAVTVYDDGTPLGVGTYSIDYMTGKFALKNAPSGAVTTDIYYLSPLVSLGQAHAWSLDIPVEMLDLTDFSGSSWKSQAAGLMNWTGKLQRYYLNSYFWSHTSAAKALLFKFFIDGSEGLWGWGGFTVSISESSQNLVGESIDIKGLSNLAWF